MNGREINAGAFDSCQSLVQAELGAVVQTHVGVAQQAAGRLPQRGDVHIAQLLLRQGEEAAHLRTRPHLGDVEAVLSTWVKESTETLEHWFFNPEHSGGDFFLYLLGLPYCQKTASRWGGARA